MIISINFNYKSYLNVTIKSVTFCDSCLFDIPYNFNIDFIKKNIKERGFMTSIFEIDCWLFCDFDNIDINTWDNNRIDKRYLNDIINKAKPYIREYKIKKLLNEKTYI